MFKTNLKIAWRNLLKDNNLPYRIPSAWVPGSPAHCFRVNDEMSYDKFFANDDRLYQLMENNSEPSSGPLSELVKKQISGVQYAATGKFAGKDYFMRKA